MQKIINVIAIFSGVVSLSVVAGGGYVYLNKDAMLENAKEKVTIAVTEAISGVLPELVNKSVPDVTGGAVPMRLP